MRRATISRIRSHHFRALALLLAAALAAGLLALAGTKPAEAAFPEVNGQIAFSSTRHGNHEIYAMQSNVFDPSSGKPSPSSGKPIRLTNNPANDYLPTYSADGKEIAFVSNRDDDYEIFMMDNNGKNLKQITFNSARESNPDRSSGLSIAFESNRDGNDEIYTTVRYDGLGQTNITNNAASDQHPTYSPDGTKLAFMSNRHGNYEIYIMNSNGSGTPTRLTNNSVYDAEPVWSPDGTKIAFVSIIDGKYEIYRMDINPATNDATRLTYNPATTFPTNLYDYHPTWSPDGKNIAFVSTRRDGNHEMYVMNASSPENTTTNKPERLTDNKGYDFNPAWDAQRSTSYSSDVYAGWSVHPDNTVRSVQGSWVVPTVRCDAPLTSKARAQSRAAPWVGMWGNKDSVDNETSWIAQIATISQCWEGFNGRWPDLPAYAAYAELYPRPKVYLFDVKPGDRMYAHVRYDGLTSDNRLKFYLYIQNKSTGKSALKTWQTDPKNWQTDSFNDPVKAEDSGAWQGGCIVESQPDGDLPRPYGGLAKFETPIKFDSPGCTVNGKGLGTYSGYDTLFRYDMQPEAGNDLATTGNLDPNGLFPVTWIWWR